MKKAVIFSVIVLLVIGLIFHSPFILADSGSDGDSNGNSDSSDSGSKDSKSSDSKSDSGN